MEFRVQASDAKAAEELGRAILRVVNEAQQKHLLSREARIIEGPVVADAEDLSEPLESLTDLDELPDGEDVLY